MRTVNCIYFQSDGKCTCKSLKKWYGKPKCVQIVDWNNFCTHKVMTPKPPYKSSGQIFGL